MKEKSGMTKFFKFVFIILLPLTIQVAQASSSDHLALLKEMFQKVTVEKNANAIPSFYAPDFVLFSNAKSMDYQSFLALHQEIYKTPIQ